MASSVSESTPPPLASDKEDSAAKVAQDVLSKIANSARSMLSMTVQVGADSDGRLYSSERFRTCILVLATAEQIKLLNHLDVSFVWVDPALRFTKLLVEW